MTVVRRGVGDAEVVEDSLLAAVVVEDDALVVREGTRALVFRATAEIHLLDDDLTALSLLHLDGDVLGLVGLYDDLSCRTVGSVDHAVLGVSARGCSLIYTSGYVERSLALGIGLDGKGADAAQGNLDVRHVAGDARQTNNNRARRHWRNSGIIVAASGEAERYCCHHHYKILFHCHHTFMWLKTKVSVSWTVRNSSWARRHC